MSSRHMSNTAAEQQPVESPEEGFFQKHGQKLFALLIWVGLIGGYTWYVRANDLTAIEAVQSLIDFLDSPIGPLVYLLAYAVRPLLFFSATVLTIAAGSIYGPVWGVIYTVIAANTSAMIAYLIGRYFGQGFLDEEQIADSALGRYTKRMRDESFITVFIMRLIFLPYDLVNYLSGFLRIEWKSYLLATALGSIPGTISFVLFGSSIDIRDGIENVEFDPWSLVAAVAIFVVSLGISRVVRRREEANTESGAAE